MAAPVANARRSEFTARRLSTRIGVRPFCCRPRHHLLRSTALRGQSNYFRPDSCSNERRRSIGMRAFASPYAGARPTHRRLSTAIVTAHRTGTTRSGAVRCAPSATRGRRRRRRRAGPASRCPCSGSRPRRWRRPTSCPGVARLPSHGGEPRHAASERAEDAAPARSTAPPGPSRRARTDPSSPRCRLLGERRPAGDGSMQGIRVRARHERRAKGAIRQHLGDLGEDFQMRGCRRLRDQQEHE